MENVYIWFLTQTVCVSLGVVTTGVCAKPVFAAITNSLSVGWGGLAHAQLFKTAAGCWSNWPGVVQYTPLKGVGGWPLIFTPPCHSGKCYAWV